MLFPSGFGSPGIAHLLFPSHSALKRSLSDEDIAKTACFVLKFAYFYYGNFD